MIDIKIKDHKASIKMEGTVPEMLTEIFLINSNFYKALKEKDPVGALSYEISIMELITGSRFGKERK